MKPCRNGTQLIELHFRNVAGKLQADGLPSGFVFVGPGGVKRVIYDCRLDGNKVLLYCAISKEDLGGLNLHYGHGLTPACNISDGAGRSFPVMGPIELFKPRAGRPGGLLRLSVHVRV